MMIDLERDLEALAGRLRASTVGVRSERGRGSGSGIVWSAPRTIVTNAHVAVTRGVEVELADGRRLSGTVERRDEQRDLASIRVEADELCAAEYRDPGDLRVGEVLVAFGHPLGVRNVLTTGIAFGPHRPNGDRFVRADLRLAPGNSGGALADVRGRVVGITSMIAGGLALAVPTDAVRRFMGEAVPGNRFGVGLAPVRMTGRRPAYAVLAIEPRSPAERSGIIPGDIILAPDPRRLRGATSVEVLRGGRALRLTIDWPQHEGAAAA
jgi:serine protease Do